MFWFDIDENIINYDSKISFLKLYFYRHILHGWPHLLALFETTQTQIIMPCGQLLSAQSNKYIGKQVSKYQSSCISYLCLMWYFTLAHDV